MRGKLQKVLLFARGFGLIISSAYVFGTALLCGLVEEASWCQFWPHFSLSKIKYLVQSAGLWGVVVSIGLMVLHSFVPFPAEFITITNGVVFGVVKGIVITWIGAMLGAFLAFGLARKLGRPFVLRKLKGQKLQRVEELIDNYGGGALLISRFIPVISFNLINYAAGLTNISWWTFTWATGLGILPLTILMVVMGNAINTLPWQVWFLVLAVGLSSWLLAHHLSKHLLKKTSKNKVSNVGDQ
jgi:uncharacterized membrane protein YdjX (TVP38/TMEM64 family)